MQRERESEINFSSEFLNCAFQFDFQKTTIWLLIQGLIVVTKGGLVYGGLFSCNDNRTIHITSINELIYRNRINAWVALKLHMFYHTRPWCNLNKLCELQTSVMFSSPVVFAWIYTFYNIFEIENVRCKKRIAGVYYVQNLEL